VARKGWPEALKDVHVTADVKNHWISYQPFISEGMRSYRHKRRSRKLIKQRKAASSSQGTRRHQIREPVAATIDIADIRLS
jgi:hypothetical protein